jgi:DNA topoisomerase-1
MFSRINILEHYLSSCFNNVNKTDHKNNNINVMNGGNKKEESKKWTTLEHNGVKFPPLYEQKNIPIIYDNKEIYLEKDAEEVAFLYAKYIDSEYAKVSTFNKNFFNDWKKILGKNTIIKSLDLCDFTKMKSYLDNEKEKKKLNKTNEDTQNDNDNDTKYKTAILDGKIQDVSNYRIEPIGLFIGRGKNSNLGKLKKRLYPEDIILNIDKKASIPKIPDFLVGHKWGKIVHKNTMEWLASWKDNITGKTKYLWLAHHSDLKADGDLKKFEFARKLKKKIKHIEEINNNNLNSSDLKTKQIASSLYFINKLAIRVGNEKSDDSSDVVGVTNLRVEHIDLSVENEITLNFLGKDSVPYTNTVQVEKIVYENIKEFVKGKDKFDQVFDKINSNDVNSYLQSFMTDLTAKVFRTYNASNFFQKELRKITNKYEGQTNKEKMIIDDFIKANLKVAKLLNHQKKIAKGYKDKVDKISETLKNLKKQLKNAKKEKIEKIKEKINSFKSKKEIVKEMKNISLDTSKANYVDPRIIVAFMKINKLDINKIFSKGLQKKFFWAFDVDENYKF